MKAGFENAVREQKSHRRGRLEVIRGRNGGHVVDDGSRMSGANGCRGASWSELTATPRSMSANWSRMDSPSPGHRRPIFLQLQKMWYCPDFNM